MPSNADKISSRNVANSVRCNVARSSAKTFARNGARSSAKSASKSAGKSASTTDVGSTASKARRSPGKNVRQAASAKRNG